MISYCVCNCCSVLILQIKEELSTLFGPISVKLPQFDFEVSKSVVKVDSKKTAESPKPLDKSEAQPSTKKTEPEVGFI